MSVTILLPDKPIIQYPVKPEVVDYFILHLLNRGFDLQSKRFNLIWAGIIPLGLKISHLDGVLTAVEAYVDKQNSMVTMECRQPVLYGAEFVDLLHDIGQDYPETELSGIISILMVNETKH